MLVLNPSCPLAPLNTLGPDPSLVLARAAGAGREGGLEEHPLEARRGEGKMGGKGEKGGSLGGAFRLCQLRRDTGVGGCGEESLKGQGGGGSGAGDINTPLGEGLCGHPLWGQFARVCIYIYIYIYIHAWADAL